MRTNTHFVFHFALFFCAMHYLPVSGFGSFMQMDPGDCKWDRWSDSSEERLEAESAKVGDKLYVFAGFTAGLKITGLTEIYEPATDTWSKGADMPVPVTHMGTAVAGDDVWHIAGFEGNNPGDAVDIVQVYNTKTDTWREGPPLPFLRASGAAAYLDGKIYYFGGLKPNRRTDVGEHFVLDLEKEEEGWTELAPLPFPRNHLSAVAIEGKIYAIGGQYGHDGPIENTQFLQVYDPDTDKWSRLADLPFPRSHFEPGTFEHQNTLVIVGGRAGPKFFDNVSRYNPATDKWTELCPLQSTLLAPVAKVFGDEIVVTNGGRNGTAKPQNKTWRMPIPDVTTGGGGGNEPDGLQPMEDDLEVAERMFKDYGRFLTVMEYPNPAVGHVTLHFELPEDADVEIRLTDLQGRRQTLIPSRHFVKGRQEIRVDLSAFPPGAIIYQLRVGKRVVPGRIIKVR